MISSMLPAGPLRSVPLLRGVTLSVTLLCSALLSSLSAQPVIQTDPESVDFGTIDVGQTVTDSLAIVNRGSASAFISVIYFEDEKHFLLLTPGTSLTLPRNVFVRKIIAFSPSGEGCFQDTLVIVWDQGITRVPVEGCALDTAKEGKGWFALDGGAGWVGDTITSRLILMLDPLAAPPPDRLDYSVHFGPDALWPLQVRTPDRVDPLSSVFRPADGRIEGSLALPEGLPRASETVILEVDWIGLSTGKPVNEIVAVLQGSTDAATIRIDTAVTGTILLDGCTVDSPPFTRRIAARSVSVDPEGMLLQVDLTMPQGSRVEFGVVDMEGRRMAIGEVSREGVISPGDDPEQTTRIRFDLAPIPRGVHALQVRLGSDRLTIPFLRP